MTLDEAIEHLICLIKKNEFNCEECKQEHIQLLNWLRELRTYKTKETPKKPIKRIQTVADEVDYFTDEVISTEEIEVHVCPICGNDVKGILNIFHSPRCRDCGQALDLG